MNNKALIKIIIWSTVAFMLVAIMVLLSISDNFMDFITNSFGGNIHNTKTIKKTELDAMNIDNIDIKWTYGNVYISTYDGDKIIIDERSNKNLDEDELFDINEENGTIYLKQQNHNVFNFFGIINRKLVRYIKLPSKLYNRIKTNFTSGDLQMDDVKMKYFDLKMTSGKTDVNNTTSDTLDIDITSGNIDIKGVFNDINAYATSGSMKIKTAVAPASLLINITSGNASVTIPDNEGFILSENKTSGFFHSDFKLDDYNTYKNGQNKYKIKITSGRVNLFKSK